MVEKSDKANLIVKRLLDQRKHKDKISYLSKMSLGPIKKLIADKSIGQVQILAIQDRSKNKELVNFLSEELDANLFNALKTDYLPNDTEIENSLAVSKGLHAKYHLKIEDNENASENASIEDILDIINTKDSVEKMKWAKDMNLDFDN